MYRVVLLTLLFVLGPMCVCGAEESSEATAMPKEGVVLKEGAGVSKGGKKPTYNAGVFFGHILYVDPHERFIFARPTDPKYSRQSFYLDAATLFTRMEEGKAKAISKADLVDGDKVAIRYFARNELSLADEVFVVVGQFQPEVYQRRRGKKSKS